MALGAMERRGSIMQSATIKGEDGIVSIGSCSHPGQQSSTINPEKTSTIIDGTLPGNLELEEIGGEANAEALAETIRAPGAFAILAISEGRLLAVRDVVGQKPLYYGEDRDGIVALASLRKALTKIGITNRSEEHTSELQSRLHLVCRLLLEKKKKKQSIVTGESPSKKQKASVLKSKLSINGNTSHALLQLN